MNQTANATSMTLEPGTRIGKFQINEFLGKGSQADVYRAYQESLDRDAALKILHPQWAANPSFLERFQREARRMAQLEHEHIVPIYDWGQEGPHTYLTMKFVPGGALDDLLKTTGLMELDAALDVAWQVARALDFAHANGIIHRDVKPGNVLIGDDGKCYLTDFGIAKALEDDLDLTTAGAVFGTARYMSPEQCQAQELDGRSDLYALATMVFEMVTGALPFTGKNAQAIAFHKLGNPPSWPEGSRERLGAKVVEALERSLSVDPDERPSTCAELIGELDAVLRANEPEPWAPAPPDVARPRPAAFFGSAVACGLALGAGAFFAGGGFSAPIAPPSGLPTSQNPTNVAGSPDAEPPVDSDTWTDDAGRSGAPVVLPTPGFRPLPLGPPPTWPLPDAAAPQWSGPSRVAVRLDGSATTWSAQRVPQALQDCILEPLRETMDQNGWELVASVAHPLPKCPFQAVPEWIQACAEKGSDLTLLVGVTDLESSSIPGVGFSPATWGADVVLHGHLVGTAEAGEVATPLSWERSGNEFHAEPDQAVRGTIREHASGVVAELAERAATWRMARAEEGLAFDVAIATGDLPTGSGAWIQEMLTLAPGGVPEDFQSLGGLIWSKDDPPVPVSVPPAVDLDRTYRVAPGLDHELEDGQQLQHYRLRYRGTEADLLAYVREGLERYAAWAIPDRNATVRVVQEGGAFLFVLP